MPYLAQMAESDSSRSVHIANNFILALIHISRHGSLGTQETTQYAEHKKEWEVRVGIKMDWVLEYKALTSAWDGWRFVGNIRYIRCTNGYIHSLTESICDLMSAGYKSNFLCSSVSQNSLNSEFSIRMISLDSLFTITPVFLSNSTGTVTRPS